MISVCMATYNGEKFIREQIASILLQLKMDDELIISDDGSTDRTLEIIGSFLDKRIVLLHHTPCGIAWNFENALKHANGDYIFLADQDDVWLPGKVTSCLEKLHDGYDFIVTNCTVTDQDLNIESYQDYNSIRPISLSFFRNFVTNSILGACTAFSREVLEAVVPFPRRPYMHDTWITFFSFLNFESFYITESYMLYRRHNETVSFLGKKNTNTLFHKIQYRAFLLFYLTVESIKYQLCNKFRKTLR